MNDYLIYADTTIERNRFVLEDSGFKEVPSKFRQYYRAYNGDVDCLAENEVLCPVCRVVLRAVMTLVPGDKIYCLVCSSWLKVENRKGILVAVPIFNI